MSAREQAPSKTSHLSKRINEEIKLVAAFMGVVCLVGAMLSTIWSSQVREATRFRAFPFPPLSCLFFVLRINCIAPWRPPLYHLPAVISASFGEKLVREPALSEAGSL